jgi:hypothetical protein
LLFQQFDLSLKVSHEAVPLMGRERDSVSQSPIVAVKAVR